MLTNTDLAGDVFSNYLQKGRDVVESCGGEWFERDGIVIKNTGIDVTGENGVYVTRRIDDPMSAIGEAVRYFTKRAVPYAVLVPSGIDPAAEQACLDLGMALVRAHPGMALHPVPDPIIGPPPWLDIRRVRTAADHDVQVQTDAAGFGGDLAITSRLFPASGLDRPGVAEFVGFVDGTPVATSVVRVTGRTAGIYGVTTIASHRGRGIGEAMTWAAVREGVAQGATIASLQASDDGERLYRRMGFRLVLPIQIYAPVSGAG
jgi:ribosomal protein S18 acetylase RimI-like enzyme